LSILQRKNQMSNGDGVSLQSFEIKDDVRLHMYCSEAPCMTSLDCHRFYL
jgi:hypothetical protein